MIFEGKIDLDVPAAKTWDFLIDINKFSSCLPGLQEVKQIDDKTFDGVIAANVGPISGKFSFRAMIVESKPPEQMVVKTEGTDSVTKSTDRCVLDRARSTLPAIDGESAGGRIRDLPPISGCRHLRYKQ